MRHLLLGLLVVSLLGAAFAAGPVPPKGKIAPVMQAVTLEGTVQAIRVPHGIFSGNAVSIMLASDHRQYRLTLGPKQYLKKIGLSLKKGGAVTVNGWQREAKETQEVKVTVRDLAIDGQTYELRGENMKPLWMKPKTQEAPTMHTLKPRAK